MLGNSLFVDLETNNWNQSQANIDAFILFYNFKLHKHKTANIFELIINFTTLYRFWHVSRNGSMHLKNVTQPERFWKKPSGVGYSKLSKLLPVVDNCIYIFFDFLVSRCTQNFLAVWLLILFVLLETFAVVDLLFLK